MFEGQFGAHRTSGVTKGGCAEVSTINVQLQASGTLTSAKHQRAARECSLPLG
jgi:hypothetical protein